MFLGSKLKFYKLMKFTYSCGLMEMFCDEGSLAAQSFSSSSLKSSPFVHILQFRVVIVLIQILIFCQSSKKINGRHAQKGIANLWVSHPDTGEH